jgi:hypothetical protein
LFGRLLDPEQTDKAKALARINKAKSQQFLGKSIEDVCADYLTALRLEAHDVIKRRLGES